MIFLYFVLGLIFEDLTISRSPEMSSNALQYTEGTTLIVDIFSSCISLIKFVIGMTSRSDMDRLMYSTSIVFKVYCVCNFELHAIRHPACKIKNPERNLVVLTSSTAIDLYQLHEKSASVYPSSDLLLFCVRIKPLSLDFRKFLTICFTARKWEIPVFSQNLEH